MITCHGYDANNVLKSETNVFLGCFSRVFYHILGSVCVCGGGTAICPIILGGVSLGRGRNYEQKK